MAPYLWRAPAPRCVVESATSCGRQARLSRVPARRHRALRSFVMEPGPAHGAPAITSFPALCVHCAGRLGSSFRVTDSPRAAHAECVDWCALPVPFAWALPMRRTLAPVIASLALACATAPHEGEGLPVSAHSPSCTLERAVLRAVRATSPCPFGAIEVQRGGEEVIVELRSRVREGEPVAVLRVQRGDLCTPHEPKTTLDGFGPAASGYTTVACVEGRTHEVKIVERSRREEDGDPPEIDALLAALADAC